MASVSGVSSTNVSSIYGSSNIISGLASGLDTESMIENSLSGLRMKVSGLQQKQTSLIWKQDAYRSITDSLVQFSRKYTSYTSTTNLSSPSFFNNAITTTTGGENASKVSATGRTTSNIQVNGVAQLATAGRYQVNSGGVLDTVATTSDGKRQIISGEAISLDGNTYTSKVSGNVSIQYGGNSLNLSFSDSEVFDSQADFVAAIQQKLSEQTITFSGSGTTGPASDYINVGYSGGKITLTDKVGGNEVYISGLNGTIKETFGSTTYDSSTKNPTLDLNGVSLKKQVTVASSVFGASMDFTLDGTKKSITFPTESELATYMSNNGGVTREDAMVTLLQDKLDKAFGTGKVTVGDESTTAGKLQLSYTVGKGSSMSISSSANSALGFGSGTATTALDTSKTLGMLLGSNLGGLSGGTLLKAEGNFTQQNDGTYKDSAGNLVNQNGERLGADGQKLYGFDLKINGETVGTYTRDTALESVLLDINNNASIGASVSYSNITNQFVFTSQETGSGHNIQIGGGLGEAIFGSYNASNFTAGQDAIVNMTVNGTNLTLTRSTNTFDVDGMSITAKGTFNGSMVNGAAEFDFLDASGMVDETLLDEPVTFTTAADSDKIADAVKSMIEDYNKVLTDLRQAFNTTPATKSNGSKYQPLTDSDRESMTESAITNYEETAKQGILFADRDLSALYNKLLSAFTPGGSDGAALRNMGITTTYSNGLTQIELDETKLRDMLSSNPDAVRDAFTKVSGEGSATSGLMPTLKKSLDAYASVDGASKGILITKAGSKYSALSLLQNNLKTQIDSYDTQIEKWQDKISNQIDYYTRQYTQLEKLISQMNEQSSSISGLMGGYQ